MPRPRSTSAAPYLERSGLRLVNHDLLDYSDETELSRPCSATPLDTLVGYRAVSSDLVDTDSVVYPRTPPYPLCSRDLASRAPRPPSSRPASIAGETRDPTCGQDIIDRRGAHSAPPKLAPTAWVFSSLWTRSYYNEDAEAVASRLRTFRGQSIDMLPLDDMITARNTSSICQVSQDRSEHLVQLSPCNRAKVPSTTSHREHASPTAPDTVSSNKKGSRKGRHERERARDSNINKDAASSATETLRRRAEKRQRKRAKRAAKKATAEALIDRNALDIPARLSQCESSSPPSAYAFWDVLPQIDHLTLSEPSCQGSHDVPLTAGIDSPSAVDLQRVLEARDLAAPPPYVTATDLPKSVYDPHRLLESTTSETINVNIPRWKTGFCDDPAASVQSEAMNASVLKVAQKRKPTTRMTVPDSSDSLNHKLNQNPTLELPHDTSTACRAVIASALGLTPSDLVRKDLVSLSGYACFRVRSDDRRPVVPAQFVCPTTPTWHHSDGTFRQPMVTSNSANDQVDQQEAALVGVKRKKKHKQKTNTKTLDQQRPVGRGGQWQSQDASIHSTSASDSQTVVVTIFSNRGTYDAPLAGPQLASNTQPVPLSFLHNGSAGEIRNVFNGRHAQSTGLPSPTANSSLTSLSSPSSPSMLAASQLSDGEARMESSWVLLYAIIKRLQYLQAEAEDYIKLESSPFHLSDGSQSRLRLCSSAVGDFVQSMRAQTFLNGRGICVTMCPDELTRQLLIAEALYARACGLREPSWKTVCEAMWHNIADHCP